MKMLSVLAAGLVCASMAGALGQEADELLERIISDEDYAAAKIRYRLSPEKLGDLADQLTLEHQWLAYDVPH